MAPRQLDLFARPGGPEALDVSDAERLAARVPKHVRFGTSSWTFPGWAGLVYAGRPSERELTAHGLEEYARFPLFRTVGIDRSYYRPLDAATARRYASQLPAGFLCVAKVWSQITAPRRREGGPNPAFLDPAAFEHEVLGPLAPMAEHQGPMVLEFPPMTAAHVGEVELCRQLERFFGAVPKELSYAVELRNRELLTPRYLDVLARHGVAHVLNFWEAMPPVGVQLDLPGVLTAPFVVTRLLIPPGKRYAARKEELAPFDRIADPQEAMRADVVRLSEACAARDKVLFVIVNNKAEGSSPLTVIALAERLATTDAAP